MKKQVDKIHYNWSTYVDMFRWCSYWHQISEVKKLQPKSVLIVGAGDNIVKDILAKDIQTVKEADIDPELDADYVGSVTELSQFTKEKFDVVLCSQVLEHLPFNLFEQCISELQLTTKKYVVLSLPQKYYQFDFVLTAFSKKLLSQRFTFCIEKKHRRFIAPTIDGHYWEVGVKGCSKEKVRALLNNYFTIINEFSIVENPYHRFYILEKSNA